MFSKSNFIYCDWFAFCSIPRLFVYLRMRMSTGKQYANVYVNQYSYVRGQLRECRSIIWSGASRLPYYCAPCMRLCCNWVASCVAALHTTNQKKPRKLIFQFHMKLEKAGKAAFKRHLRQCPKSDDANRSSGGPRRWEPAPNQVQVCSPNVHWWCCSNRIHVGQPGASPVRRQLNALQKTRLK